MLFSTKSLFAVACSYAASDHHRTGIELALEASMPSSSSSSNSDDSHGPYGVDLETLAVKRCHILTLALERKFVATIANGWTLDIAPTV